MARAHLFPRKLIHEIRREAKYVVGLRAAGKKVGFLQSGEVSRRILCHRHEGETQAFDDAAIRLIRLFSKQARPAYDGLAWVLPNRKSDRVVRFVHATIWKYWAHWTTGHEGPSFPSHLMPAVQSAVFDDGPPLPTLMLHAGRTHNGGDALYAFAPGQSELDGVPITRFEVGGFAFFMFHREVQRGSVWSELQASNDPLTILQLDHGELRTDPLFMHFVSSAETPQNM